jgi:hemerythrin-like domain-containing protein
VNDKDPIGLLSTEHRVIHRVVNSMISLYATLEQNGDAKVGTLLKIVDFMRTFAGQCHHGKEQGHLFPILERRSVSVDWYPLEELISDHERTRVLVQELAGASKSYPQGDLKARESLAKSLRGLINLCPNHMWKEDYLLFPMANRLVSPKQWRDLREKFDAVDAGVGRDTYRQLEQLANGLQEEGGVTT